MIPQRRTTPAPVPAKPAAKGAVATTVVRTPLVRASTPAPLVARPAPPPPPPPAVPMPLGLSRMFEITNRLADHIEAEVALLNERRPRELANTAAVKEELARAYQEELNALRAHPQVVKNAPKSDLAAVRAAGERLNAVLDQQRRRVQAAKEVSERMLRAVTQEVERQKTPYQTYNRAATYSKPGRKAQVAAPTALAFHEVV